MKPAARVGRLLTESAFDVLVKARALEAQGRNIIHLEIGEPDFPTPAHIVEAGKRALDQGLTHYGPTQGTPELREAVAKHVGETRGFPVSADRVCITPGAKPVLFLAMSALLEPGDEVIYPDPGFPIYESLIRYLEAVPVPMRAGQVPPFSDRTRLVILNSPENPTGRVQDAAVLQAIAAEVLPRDCLVLSDEIYSRICYGPPPASIASLTGMAERTILLDGFSKTYAMTGWRLGYGVMPEWLVAAVNRLTVNSNSCTATFTQHAGIAALTGPQDDVGRMIAEFRRRRDLFCSGLDNIPGVRCELPGGAFYAWADIRGTGFTSRHLAERLLNEAGVACLNGASFGEAGDGFLRFSYANSYQNLVGALDRIRDFLKASPH